MIPHAALLATLIPGVSGMVIYFAKKYVKKNVGWWATVSASLSVILLLSMVMDVINSHQTGGGSITFVYPWITPIDLTFSFLIDVVNLPISLIVAIVSTLACFYSIKYMADEKGQRRYYGNLLVFMTGMIGVMLSSNLIQFYLFWELMLIPSYFLIVYWGTSENRLASGFKYFIITHIGALCMLLGFLLINSYTETFDLIEISIMSNTIPSSMMVNIFVLLLIGFFVKMAVFPVHIWLPDAHTDAPTPISAMLSGVMVKCGAYGIARILFSSFPQILVQFSNYLMILAIVTIVYGGLMALAQTDIKRLLAYSSISQMGYIVFGFGTATTQGMMGGLLHVVNHAICKALLFMCAGLIMHQTGTRDIRKMGGLIERMPVTGIACLLGAFGLIGVPPLNGFWSELMILRGGFSSGKVLNTVICSFSTVITAGYYLWFVWRIFFGAIPKDLNNVKEASWLQCLPIIILAAACILLGIFPGLALTFITPAAEYLSSFLMA